MAAVQNRILIDLSDILLVRVRCSECGHDALHPLDADVPLPNKCQRCRETFWPFDSSETPEGQMVTRLQKMLLCKKKRGARLVLEIDANLLNESSLSNQGQPITN